MNKANFIVEICLNIKLENSIERVRYWQESELICLEYFLREKGFVEDWKKRIIPRISEGLNFETCRFREQFYT